LLLGLFASLCQVEGCWPLFRKLSGKRANGDVLDVFHAFDQPQSLFLVLKDASADVGVQPDQISDGGLIGTEFELMGHGLPIRSDQLN
jgi:hypothetical protein